jgi:hypothetical protein
MTTDSLGRQSQVLARNSTMSRGATTAVASDVHSMTRHHPSSLRDSLATVYPNLGLAPKAISQSRSATKPTIIPYCNLGAIPRPRLPIAETLRMT